MEEEATLCPDYILQCVCLFIYENSLIGLLPSEMGLMTGMTDLAVEYNHFSRALPSELESISNMTKLGLSHNSFVGWLPSALGDDWHERPNAPR
jgi:hypothetical protein